MKLTGSGSESGSESESISQRHGTADPDPHQNVMDPEHWFSVRARLFCFIFSSFQITLSKRLRHYRWRIYLTKRTIKYYK
jgi:hypothetical protein